MNGTPILEQDSVALPSVHSSGVDVSDRRHGADKAEDCRGEPRGGHPPAANISSSQGQGRSRSEESPHDAAVRVASEDYQESKWSAVASTERKGKEDASGGDEEASSSGAEVLYRR